jgi:predicted O-linked N-acetylglucosamine transferase (SPINDLY family)
MRSISFEKAVEIALEQHRAGNFARAEALYIEILRQDPGNVDAIHLLGVLAHQGKRSDMAVQLIGRAISRKPDVAAFHYNYAEALGALDRRDEAIASYRRAIELNPDYFEAHVNLANALNERHRFADAESACRKAIELRPQDPAPWNNLGNALRGLSRAKEAIDAYEKAIALRPDFVEAINNLATALCWVGRLDEGLDQFRAAIRLRPTLADAHNNMGTVLSRLNRHDEAAACFQTALDIKPDHAEANNNLGAALRALGRLDDSIPFFRKAVELRKGFIEAYTNLAASLTDLGKKREALEAIDAALAVRSDLPKERFLRGIILRDLYRIDEGIEELREALRLEPDSVASLTALGYALLERGDLDEAMSVLRRALELKPDPQTHSNALLTMSYHPGYSPADLLEAHKSFAELHEKPQIPFRKPHNNDRSPERKLRIGYVSPDFRGHSVSYFLDPILEHHDHGQFEIFGYAHVTTPDLSTWWLRARIDHWRETAGLRPEAFADLVREDGIDILIDLAGHTANNSLTMFALKPAPVLVNMIGFPSTTGLSAMDYRVTDALCDPPGVTDPFNTETLLRMPKVFWCYRPPPEAGEVGALPADANGYVTLTSVNNFTKVTPHVRRCWAQILSRVPDSHLIIQTSATGSEHTKRKVLELFAEHGVSADRIEFRGWSDLRAYLALLERSDLTLDPFPFNGGTTTCHSLWMGAPVVSLAGRTHCGRMGLSMLTTVGLPELCAADEEGYVTVAVNVANDRDRLRDLRASLREQMSASPLMDGSGYVRDLENAYRSIWRKWCHAG